MKRVLHQIVDLFRSPHALEPSDREAQFLDLPRGQQKRLLDEGRAPRR